MYFFVYVMICQPYKEKKKNPSWRVRIFVTRVKLQKKAMSTSEAKVLLECRGIENKLEGRQGRSPEGARLPS